MVCSHITETEGKILNLFFGFKLQYSVFFGYLILPDFEAKMKLHFSYDHLVNKNVKEKIFKLNKTNMQLWI